MEKKNNLVYEYNVWYDDSHVLTTVFADNAKKAREQFNNQLYFRKKRTKKGTWGV